MEYIDTPYRVNNLFLTWHNLSRVKDGGEKGERMVMKIYPSFLWDTLSPSAFCLLRDGKSNGFVYVISEQEVSVSSSGRKKNLIQI